MIKNCWWITYEYFLLTHDDSKGGDVSVGKSIVQAYINIKLVNESRKAKLKPCERKEKRPIWNTHRPLCDIFQTLFQRCQCKSAPPVNLLRSQKPLSSFSLFYSNITPSSLTQLSLLDSALQIRFQSSNLRISAQVGFFFFLILLPVLISCFFWVYVNYLIIFKWILLVRDFVIFCCWGLIADIALKYIKFCFQSWYFDWNFGHSVAENQMGHSLFFIFIFHFPGKVE